MSPEGEPMDQTTLLQAFAGFRYAEDERNPPTDAREREFRTGWDDATARGRDYTKRPLSRLRWRNFGYRLGKAFGPLLRVEIDEAFEFFAGRFAGRQVASPK
jgi:hypothetical protein